MIIGNRLRRQHPTVDWPALIETSRVLWEAKQTSMAIARKVRDLYGITVSHTTVANLAKSVSAYRPGAGRPGIKTRNTCVDCPAGPPYRCRRCSADAKRKQRARRASEPTDPAQCLRRAPLLCSPEQPWKGRGG